MINIENCQISPSFPMLLQVQNKLNSITLRNTGIADKIPHSWFSRIVSDVTQLYLENNRIKGILPQNLVFLNLAAFDLTSNNFQGSFPRWTANRTQLCLYQNNFSGNGVFLQLQTGLRLFLRNQRINKTTKCMNVRNISQNHNHIYRKSLLMQF